MSKVTYQKEVSLDIRERVATLIKEKSYQISNEHIEENWYINFMKFQEEMNAYLIQVFSVQ